MSAPVKCLFCGKFSTSPEVKLMVTSDDGGAICNNCVTSCVTMLARHKKTNPRFAEQETMGNAS